VSRRVLFVASLALVVVFLVRWSVPSDRNNRIIPALPDTRFDYTLTDFSATFYNALGIPEWIIEAPKLVHDSGSKTALIERPEIQIDPNNENWLATANQGLIYRNEGQMELSGNVIIRQSLDIGDRVIRTERLHHDRRERTIRSNEPVELTDPKAIIRSGGLLINLTTDTMEFSNRVQGEIYMGDRSVDDAAPAGQRSN